MKSVVLTGTTRRCRFEIPLSLVLVIAMLLWGCNENSGSGFQGYAEGDFVLVASPLSGRLEELSVKRGDRVEVGDRLFALDQIDEAAAMVAAEQEVQRASSNLEDLRKGQRTSELRSIEARVDRAKAALDLSQQEFSRREKLLAQNAIAVEDFERAVAALDQDRAALDDILGQLETARLGARRDAVAAGQAELDAARARLAQARWALAQKSQRSMQAGLVFDTLFDPGEFVRAGYPVVSLLPPGNIKVRFFVPEQVVGNLQVGQSVTVSFDGSGGPLPATVSYISPQVEYTPPVIYSRETRAKLVFLVEARPDPAVVTRFHPGQPVDVRLEHEGD